MDYEESEIEESGEIEEPGEVEGLPRLLQFLEAPNIAELLEADELSLIGKKVVDEYDIDENSREDWLKKTQKAMDLAKQVAEEKNYPWPKAANVKYPVITNAAIQFNARAYPAIVKGNEVVSCKVTGSDPDNQKASRAKRVSEHMSYQCLFEMPEWEPDQDRQLLVLPIVGTDFKKTYFDPSMGRNVSVRVSAKDCVVNNKAKSIETAPRITQVFTLYPQEITEKKRMGVYLDVEFPYSHSDDDYEPVEFLEQHRMLDLDEDGYPEPYIVTVHKESGKVARIVSRFEPDSVTLIDETKTVKITLTEWVYNGQPQGFEIAKIEPVHYFTKFGFIPDPDGGFYDIGLGILLNPLNESINTTLNQLLDAGHLANTGGGFIGRGLRMRRGEVRFRPGEYKQIDSPGENIRNNIVPLQFPGPSPVLFQLLGMLIQAARELSSVSEVMSGDGQMAMAQPTTVMALIEQGQMVFSAIYKRVHRALGQEFRKLFKLNARYLDDQVYFRLLDDQKAIARIDYAEEDLDIEPVSDPNLATDQQKLARANFLGQFMQDPYFNAMEIRRRILEAARIEDIETLLQPPPDPGPDVGLMLEMAKLENDRAEIDNTIRKTNADIIKSIADAVYSLERAESENAGNQLEFYRIQLQAMIQSMKDGNQRARVSGMEAAPGNGVRLPDPAGGPGGANGAMGLGQLTGGGAGGMPDSMQGVQGFGGPQLG